MEAKGAGPRLKKSPSRESCHRLRRRKWIESRGRIVTGLGRHVDRLLVLQYHFNWKTLSAMAGVTWWNFYFRLFPGSIRSPQVIEFLQHLFCGIWTAGCWSCGMEQRSTVVEWFGISNASRRDGSGWSSCPPMLRNSTPSSTCCRIGSSMNCPTSVRRTFGNSATMHAKHCDACANVHVW